MTDVTRARETAFRAWGAILVLTAAGMLGGCADPAPAEREFSLEACELLSANTVDAIVGEGFASDERSVDQGGPESNWMVCGYSPADDAPRRGLTLLVHHSDANDFALYTDVWPTCDDGIPLEVDGAVGYICADPRSGGDRGPFVRVVWGDHPSYYASIHIVAYEDAPTIAETAEPLRAVVRDLIAGVDESDFSER